MQYNQHALHNVLTSHENWSTETARVVRLRDIPDGSEFKSILGDVLCTSENFDAIPLAILFYYDGLEVVNALGHAKGTHKLACFYWTLINFSPQHRTALHNINLATICLEKHVSHFEPELIVSGKPGEGRECTSWGASMRKLADGRHILAMIPDTTSSILYRRKFFCGGTFLIAADTPAANQLAGFKIAVGPSTVSVCRICHCLQHSEDTSKYGPYRQPNYFLPSLGSDWKATTQQAFRLRDATEYAQLKAKVAKLGKAKAKSELKNDGINSFTTAFERILFVYVCTSFPIDVMHILLEGVMRVEVAGLIYLMTRVFLHWRVTISKLNGALKAHKFHSGGKKIPPISCFLATGTGDKMPHSDATVSGIATQLMYFTLHSVEILGQFVPEEEWAETPAWASWLALVDILNVFLQNDVSKRDLENLDGLIVYHDTLFLDIPQYRSLWKPKSHFLSHVPLDMYRWGPCLRYWCMRFEGENQVVKAAAMSGNFF